jgi:hypothetical protein
LTELVKAEAAAELQLIQAEATRQVQLVLMALPLRRMLLRKDQISHKPQAKR